MAGSVFGMATTQVKPPRAAARLPVSTVSASSRPGWRRWACRSTRPGATTQPPASMVASADEVGADGGDAAVLDDDVGRPARRWRRAPGRP